MAEHSIELATESVTGPSYHLQCIGTNSCMKQALLDIQLEDDGNTCKVYSPQPKHKRFTNTIDNTDELPDLADVSDSDDNDFQDASTNHDSDVKEDDFISNDEECQNPIYLFFEEVSADDNSTCQNGVKYFKCWHGNQKVCKITPGMQGNLNSLIGHLKPHFLAYYCMYEVLYKCNDLPTQEEIDIACGKVALTPNAAQDYLAQLESILHNIQQMFAQQTAVREEPWDQAKFEDLLSVKSTMHKTNIKVKKLFRKKKNQKATLAGNVAFTDAPDSGTALQVLSTYQLDTGPEPGVGVTSQSGTASSAQLAEQETELQVSCAKQSGLESGAVLDTFETVLGALKEVSGPFAPLWAAVGSVIECIHIYKALAKDLISHTKLMDEHLNKDDMDASEWMIIQDLANKLDGIANAK
ncbi:hypothetical protein GYMLUDRAFT_246535 [Collybiopsis luxurians FD-317 M1]|uniref:Uncharacterized protein n=1 Tax=Collybiopsis luxurians FD-317 M1 TaxID=944289 RepID=A0A0D0B3N6_9AGAR|nr:hypothetical protein GYMLUDRAFT_246535 [Collybiopsis luxurians FD-317 M1]